MPGPQLPAINLFSKQAKAKPQYTVTKKARNILKAAKASAAAPPAAPEDQSFDPNNQWSPSTTDSSGSGDSGYAFDPSPYLAALENQYGASRGNIDQANADLLAQYAQLQGDYYSKANAANAGVDTAYANARQQTQAAGAAIGGDLTAQGFSNNPLQAQLQTQLAALEAQHANQTGLATNLRNVYAQQAADRASGAGLMHTGALNDLEAAKLAATNAIMSGGSSGGGGRGGGGGGGSVPTAGDLNALFDSMGGSTPDFVGQALANVTGGRHVQRAVAGLASQLSPDLSNIGQLYAQLRTKAQASRAKGKPILTRSQQQQVKKQFVKPLAKKSGAASTAAVKQARGQYVATGRGY